MKLKLNLLAAVLALFSYVATAELNDLTGQVLPAPQKMAQNTRKMLVAPKHTSFIPVESAKNIYGKRAFSTYILTLLEAFKSFPADKVYPTENALYFQVVYGLIDDAEIRNQLGDNIPELPAQGYVIRKTIENDKGIRVVIAGADWRGLFYGFATLRQMLSLEDGVLYLNYADVEDWPVFLERYASDDIEPGGFMDYLALANRKVSGFAWQNRTDWREFGTKESHLKVLADMQKATEQGFMDFMIMIHLYGTPRLEKHFDISNEEDLQNLIAKARLIASHKIGMIMICADDLTPRVGDDYVCFSDNPEEVKKFDNSIGKAHGYLMRRLYDALNPEFPNLRLAMVGAPYSLNHGVGKPGIDRYIKDWAAAAPKEVYWVWTGREVVSNNIEAKDLKEFTDLLNGQPTYVWDNSNCIDAPWPSWNTKFYPELAKDSNSIIYWNDRYFFWKWAIPYTLTANAYAWNPAGYDAERDKNIACGIAFGPKNVAVINRVRNAMLNCKQVITSGNREGFDKLLSEFEAAFVDLKAARDLNGKELPFSMVESELKLARDFMNIKVTSLAIPELKNDIVIDGTINPEEWASAADFQLTQRNGSEDKMPVNGKLGYTQQGLYIALDIPNTTALPDLPPQEHDSAVYLNDDNVEIYLQPSVSGAYGHWCFDYEGNKFEEKEAEGGFAWNGDWQLKTARTDKGWTAEIFIPVIELELLQPTQLKPGNMWKLNIHRVSKAYGIQSYSRGGDRFHEPEFFGELLIK